MFPRIDFQKNSEVGLVTARVRDVRDHGKVHGDHEVLRRGVADNLSAEQNFLGPTRHQA